MNNRRASERRVQPRVPVNVRSLTDQTVIAGLALDLSEGGLFIELPKKPRRLPGVVLIDMEFGGSSHRFEAVVQRADEHRGRSRLGLSFFHLGEHERNALRLYLRG
jgi:c-di-GMP-binding flagellar brake protein YcgR